MSQILLKIIHFIFKVLVYEMICSFWKIKTSDEFLTLNLQPNIIDLLYKDPPKQNDVNKTTCCIFALSCLSLLKNWSISLSILNLCIATIIFRKIERFWIITEHRIRKTIVKNSLQSIKLKYIFIPFCNEIIIHKLKNP